MCRKLTHWFSKRYAEGGAFWKKKKGGGVNIIVIQGIMNGRSQWPRGLRRSSMAARLLRSWIWIPPGASMSVCCECCVLSGRDLCDELITRPKESYQLWCVVLCYLEKKTKSSCMRTRSRTAGGLSRHEKKGYNEWLIHRKTWVVAIPARNSCACVRACVHVNMQDSP